MGSRQTARVLRTSGKNDSSIAARRNRPLHQSARIAARAVAEQLEQRVFLTVTASVSGASSVNEASAYTLGLSASSTAGTISSWSLNWGDLVNGNPDVVTYTGNPASESHTYASGPNNYTITAIATDSTNATGSATKSVTVNHVTPTVAISGNGSCGPAQEGALYNLSLTTTEAASAHSVTSLTVTWGDGSSTQTFSPSYHSGLNWYGSSSHIYSTAGTYTITATATDDVGSYSNSYTVVMPHTPPALLVSRAGSSMEGSTYTLNLAGSEVGTETITSWQISWGDIVNGNPDIVTYSGNPSTVTHTYGQGYNTYTISASATDQVGTYSAIVNLDSAFGGTGRVTTDLGSNTDNGYAAAVQGDGKTVVAGTSNNNFALVRYGTNGSLDATFGGSGNPTPGKVITDFGSTDIAKAVVLQADPNNPNGAPAYIYVAGYSGSNFAIARFTGQGVLDTAFGTGGKLTTSFGTGNTAAGAGVALEYDPASQTYQIVVAGYDNGQFALARYTSAGTLDTTFGASGKVLTSFGTGTYAYGTSIAIDYSGTPATNAYYGTILVGGSDSGNAALVRYNPNGTLNTSFGSGTGKVVTNLGASSNGNALAIQANGSILLGGSISQSAGQGGNNFAITRYLPGGQIDTTFGANGTAVTDFGGGLDTAEAIALQPNPTNPNGPPQAIFVAGTTYTTSSSYNFAIAKYTGGGALDTSFGVGGKAAVGIGVSNAQGNGIVLRPDGSVVVVGEANNNLGVYNNDFASAAFLPDNTVTVLPYVPTITLSGPSSANQNAPYTLGLSAIYPQSDPYAATETAQWTLAWGDNSSPTTASGNLTSVSHTYATPGSYIITASTSEMMTGPYTSPTKTVTVAGIQPPANLAATGITSSGIDLSWSPSEIPVTGYQIRRSTDGSNWGTPVALGPATTSYNDSGLSEGTQYFYELSYVYSTGPSTFSNPIAVTTPPSAPSGLVATGPDNTNPSVFLKWTSSSSHALGFKIEQSIDGAHFLEVATAAASASAAAVGVTGPATTYYFRVRATGAGGDSLPSNIASSSPVATPLAPGGLSATPTAGGSLALFERGPSTEVHLSWANNATNATSNLIELSADGTSFNEIDSVAADATTDQIHGLDPGQVYYFRVRASNLGSDSGYSNVATANMPQVDGAQGLSAVWDDPSDSVKLSWFVYVGDPSSFTIQRSIDGTNYTDIATLPPGESTDYIYNQVSRLYYDPSRLSGVAYYYRIVSSDHSGAATTPPVVITTSAMPRAPSNFIGTALDNGAVNFTWTDNSDGETGFMVYQLLNDGGTSEIGTVGPNATSFVYGGSPPLYGTFAVEAYNAAGASFSNSAPIYSGYPSSALPEAPTSLGGAVYPQLYDGTYDHAQLSWMGNSETTTTYEIWRSTDDVNFSKIATVPVSANQMYTDTGLGAPQTYYYRVRADNANGVSAFSNTYSVNTHIPTIPLVTGTGENAKDDQSTGGLLIPVDNTDLNNNGIPDSVDGFTNGGANTTLGIYGENFTPIAIGLPPVNPATTPMPNLGEIRFTYSGSDPSLAAGSGSYASAAYRLASIGSLRIWTKDGGQLRDASDVSAGGDYIVPGETYSMADFGVLPTPPLGIRPSDNPSPTLVLYVEAVKPSASIGDLQIHVDYNADPQGPNGFNSSDAARFTAVASHATRDASLNSDPTAGGWSGPVRLVDGTIAVSANDLSTSAFGLDWDQDRVWTNEPGMNWQQNSLGPSVSPQISSAFGNNIEVPELPGSGIPTNFLRSGSAGEDAQGYFADGGDVAHYVADGINAVWYDTINNIISPRLYSQVQQSPSGGIVDTDGNLSVPYESFNQNNGPGYYKPASGSTVAIEAPNPYSSTGIVDIGGQTDIENAQLVYTNYPPNANGNSQCESVTLQVSPVVNYSPTGFTTIRQVVYAYYSNGDPNGNAGDLKTATIEDASGNPIDTWYYRYYTGGGNGGYKGALMDVVSPDAYARLSALGNPLTATEATIQQYADDHFAYDDNQRVASVSTPGQGKRTYNYQTSNWVGSNAWSMRTTEILPDGTQNITYLDSAGEPILAVVKDTSGNQWCTFTRYDAQGRPVFTANPSAFQADGNGKFYDETLPDLIGFSNNASPYLKANAGLITKTNYFTTTTATASTPGGANGYFQNISVQQGTSGTPIVQESRDYILEVTDRRLYKVADDTVYSNADGTGAQTTHYSYAYGFNSTPGLHAIMTTLPIVSTSQNGTGQPDQTITYLDRQGRAQWTLDADGCISYTAYDPATGSVSTRIQDVNTALTNEFTNLPAGWATKAGYGANLVTHFGQIDLLGRPHQVTDPNGQITGYDYVDTATESKVTITPPAGPIEVTDTNRSGGWVDTLTKSATDNSIQSLSRNYLDKAGRVATTDRYFNLSGVSYSLTQHDLAGATAAQDPQYNAAGIVQSGNYERTQFAYDPVNDNYSTTDALGRVTQTDLNALGLVLDVKVGSIASPLATVQTDQFDNGGIGDGNLTQVTHFPGDPLQIGNVSPRITQNLFDWRDQLEATKQGGNPDPSTEDTTTNRPLILYTRDNLGEVTSQYTFDGDRLNLQDFATGFASLPAGDLAALRGEIDNSYDARQRPYSSMVVAYNPVRDGQGNVILNGDGQPASYTQGTSLTTKDWYDGNSNVIAVSKPGGLWSKTQIDGAGRTAASFVTNNSGGDPRSVSGDVVFSQKRIQYDNDGNSILTTTRDRFDAGTMEAASTGSSSAPGPLGPGNSRVDFTADWFDAANRNTGIADYGTNGGQFFTRPLTVPAPDPSDGWNGYLVTAYGYSPAGHLQTTTDPRGIQTFEAHDALGRVTEEVDGYTGSDTPTINNSKKLFFYDPIDRTRFTEVFAAQSGGQPVVRSTENVYAGSPLGTANDSSPSTIYYRDPTTDSALITTSNQENFVFNNLGDMVLQTDRSRAVHTLTYDTLDHLRSDIISPLSIQTGMDGSITSHSFAYDTFGRPVVFTALGPSAQNQVVQVYDGFGHLTDDLQAHSGTVQSGTPDSRSVYTSDSTANYSRLAQLIYPNGRILAYNDNGNFGQDATISRLTSITDQLGSSGGLVLEQYRYLGLDTAVRRDLPEAGVALSYLTADGGVNAPKFAGPLGTLRNDGGAADPYSGLDRFGRVIDQNWFIPGGGTIDRHQDGYDADGNVLYNLNVSYTNESELYQPTDAAATTVSGGIVTGGAYDPLNRETNFSVGTLGQKSGSSRLDEMAGTPAQTFSTDANAEFRRDGTAAQTARPIYQSAVPADTNVSIFTQKPALFVGFDAWGNLTRDTSATYQIIQVNGGNSYTVGYRNRTDRAYAVDALGRRISDSGNDLYYGPNGQVIEERSGGVTTAQYVWSPTSPNTLVLQDRNADGTATGSLGKNNSGLEQRSYAIQDVAGNTTAVLGQQQTSPGVYSGAYNVADRYLYSPDGQITVATPISDAPTGAAATRAFEYLFHAGRNDGNNLTYVGGQEWDQLTGGPLQADPHVYENSSIAYSEWTARNAPVALSPGVETTATILRVGGLAALAVATGGTSLAGEFSLGAGLTSAGLSAGFGAAYGAGDATLRGESAWAGASSGAQWGLGAGIVGGLLPARIAFGIGVGANIGFTGYGFYDAVANEENGRLALYRLGWGAAFGFMQLRAAGYELNWFGRHAPEADGSYVLGMGRIFRQRASADPAISDAMESGLVRVAMKYELGQDALPQHHIFPQNDVDRAWFAARGIDVDDYVLNIAKADHEAITKWAGDAPWNDQIMGILNARETVVGKLSVREILLVGAQMRRAVGLQKVKAVPFVKR